ncbi:Uncharacterised protein [Mycobacteroides abscessus subsp. abscessus]|nr:Uncharacterised protein [Mycobacteroides abscessus subsp. abscessus]
MISLPGSVPSSAGPKIGETVVPAASVRPLLACADSMRPMPASRCQLSPQPGIEEARASSALR